MPVAATFDWTFDDGSSLGAIASIDAMITLVDASTFLLELARGDALTDRRLTAADGDARSISDLLVDQVVFADVLLLNKTDLVSEQAAGTVESMLKRLNPTAKLLRSVDGNLDLSEILDTGLFDPIAAEQVPGWDEEIAGGHTPETEEYGISSLTFRSDRPFHPQRSAMVLDDMRGLLRSKGFCWIASRPDIVAIWSQAGPNMVFEPAQYWSTTDMPPAQEIVFIGIGLDHDRIHQLLRSALLTDTEYAAGKHQWLHYPDPLPAWEIAHTH